ncbi:bifunctional metallophosphatase/5'-nucleotidase [Acinetobacter rathckeae]|uniref:bifunctional metallophosphatase/5'-nucleotidase n=1 Tax=Acinetobacter rathckeae TaxID=2605272 RepID=UPI0018A2AE03|nr:5'-nucleotidase C-terminal domain-containing protein [Acinetobacter rathckeae]MBF7689092.1 5'-nucleotidase C-terminal domain-containing protein [Acinetobacter rathckeae]MBF7696658.1 5'-nucleotidase C-terminal domain-containing protein [Acinetobacter rathckeae]
MNKIAFCLVSFLPLGLGLTACQTPKQHQNTSPFTLTVAHINDHHSHLDEEQTTVKFDLGQGPENILINRGGMARVASMMKQIEQKDPNVIKIHAGDAITGDLYFNLTQGLADAAVMNQICFDSYTLGNHEFDAKDAGLKVFLDGLKQGHCKTPIHILSANVTFGPSSALYQTNRVKKSVVIERQGQKIGLVGITIAGKTKNASQPNADTVFAEEIATAQAQIDQLKAQGVDKIILQTHVGYERDLNIATQLNDVDVIIGGDSHTLLGPESLKTVGLNPVADYPTVVKNKQGDKVCIAQAWQYNYAVGELKVRFDPQGKVLDCGGQAHILLGTDMQRVKSNSPLTAQQKQQIQEYVAKMHLPLSFITPDAQMQQVLKPYQLKKKTYVDTVVGTANEAFCSQTRPTKKPKENCLTYGGDVQQLVAQAMLQQAKKYFAADLSIQNGGGVRIEIPQGPMNVATVYQLLPFKNTLVQLSMTGHEVKATLEDAIEGANTDIGAYPYTAGLRWEVDMTKAKGQRVQNLQLKNASGQYQNFDLDRTYQVATIDFLARGSNYYTTLTSIQGERRKDFSLDYADIFLNYLSDIAKNQPKKGIYRLPIADYSTQKYITQ